MNLLYSLYRLLTVGSPNRRQVGIRVVAIIIMFGVLIAWGVSYRSQPPPSSIQVDSRPTEAPISSTGQVQIGGSVSATLAEGERQAWTFDGQRGQRLSIRVLGGWDSTLEIYPPNGRAPIGGDFNSGGGYQAFMCSYRLAYDGTWTVVVSGYLGVPGKNFGAYELRVDEENYVEERPIDFGGSVEGRLSTCDGDYYTITVKTGDSLRLTLTPEDGANLYMRLLPSRDSTDTVAISQSTTGEDGATQDVIAVRALQDTTFFINVTRAPGQHEGAYTLAVADRESPESTEPAV